MDSVEDKSAALAAKRALLKQRLAKKTSTNQTVPLIVKANIAAGEELPLSFAQQRMWLLDKIDGPGSHYNIPYAFKLSGELNFAALQNALRGVLERQQSLRTYFIEDDNDQPIQRMRDVAEFEVTLTDLSGLSALPGDAQSVQMAQYIEQESGRIFDLSCDFMLAAAVLKLGDNEHVLLVTMHHVASDGWSTGVFVNEFSALYDAFAQGKNHTLAPLAVQYSDYAHWQRNWLRGEILDKQLGYWTKRLANLPVVHNLPLDYARPPIQGYVGDTYQCTVNSGISQNLKKHCQDSGVTLFMGLHAVFSVLLARYSNETDIVIGSPIANREQSEVAPLIGFFVNNLVLRSDLSNNPTFNDVLQQSKKTLLGAYGHQQVPFEKVVEKLQSIRNLSVSPLFQVMLVLQNNQQNNLELPGLGLSEINQPSRVAKYDITLTVGESKRQQGLELQWNYNTALFDESTIKQMAGNFDQLLESVLKAPDQDVFKADLLTGNELTQQLEVFNQTTVSYRKDQCIHQLFEQQVTQTPGSIALVCRDVQVDYQSLNEKANRLAHYLIEQGVTKQTLVGISAGRSIEMVVGLLAILKAGGAYVPMDPAYPQSRLDYIVKDSSIDLLLTEQAFEDNVTGDNLSAVLLDSEALQQTLQGYSTANPSTSVKAQDLAYVIYTSGSTGQPKGVMIEHQNTQSLINWATNYFSAKQLSCVLASTSLNFDLSIFELFVPLSAGHCAVIVDNILALTSSEFTHPGLTLINTVPSGIEALVEQQCVPDSVEVINLAGEALKKSLVEQIYQYKPQVQVVNLYGPSEDTTYSTVMKIDANLTEAPSIGKPIDNTKAYILNENGQLQPRGCIGELCLGGAGVTRGYLNREQMTVERFIVCPSINNERLYRTGDLVRWLPCGNLAFMGRADAQVKVRGFRIELGEIEHALASIERVNEAAVLAKDGDTGIRLVAYVAADSKALPNDFIESLKQTLEGDLPSYMVPSVFVLLGSMPLTNNGKIDRLSLPEPGVADELTAVNNVPPTTQTEMGVAAIWSEILVVTNPCINSNFFASGGHSLIATSLISRINRLFGSDLQIRELFENPTIKQLAKLVDSFKPEATFIQAPIKRFDGEMIPLSFAQQRLWFVCQQAQVSKAYNMIYVIDIEGRLEQAAIESAWMSLVNKHEALRSRYHQMNGELCQSLLDEIVDEQDALFSLQTQSATPAEVERRLAVERDFVFDLAKGPLVRAKLLQVADEHHVLLINIHHIVCDGWSVTVLINQLLENYDALVKGLPLDTTPMLVRYRDYANWQNEQIANEDSTKSVNYWQDRLDGIAPLLSLPIDRPRPAKQSFNGDSVMFTLDKPLYNAVQKLSENQQVTPFITYLSVYNILLAQFCAQKEVCIGTPVAGRSQPELEKVVGMFLNTLALRNAVDFGHSYSEILQQIKQNTLNDMAHQHIPFEHLVEAIQPQRSMGHSPVFQVMFSMLKTLPMEKPEGGLEFTRRDIKDLAAGSAKFDITLAIEDTKDGMFVEFNYNSDLFDKTTITRMADYFKLWLKMITEQPQKPLHALLAENDNTHAQMLFNANSKNVVKNESKLLTHQRVAAMAAQYPDSIALNEGAVSLTYLALEQQANQLANLLVAKGVGAEVVISLCLKPGITFAIASLAVLKAGGAYLPIDPALPPSRIDYMLQNSGSQLLLSTFAFNNTHQLAQASQCDVLFVDHDDIYQQQSTKAPHTTLTPDNLAYVIYTSGSTGMPKGVMLRHGGLCNLIDWNHRCFDVDNNTRGSQIAGVGFDASILEIWPYLIEGASIDFVEPDLKQQPDKLLDWVAQKQISHCFMPTALLEATLHQAWPQLPELKYICTGGDQLTQRLRSDVKAVLVNHYGPSENTVVATAGSVKSYGQGLPNIGQPIDHNSAYVLDEHLNMVPVGVTGQLYLGGESLARGYLNAPGQTAAKFIPNPFDNSAGGRLYSTGDLVRYLDCGDIEYVGRSDLQVQIRGFRIELGEIESQLCEQPHIKEAVVIALEDDVQGRYLAAYIVGSPSAQEAPDIGDLRKSLALNLPDYMIPVAWCVLDALPLTANGKVDRKALPKALQDKSEYVAPVSETEQKLHDIWCDVLAQPSLSVLDDFFAVGGHSLLATKIIAGIIEVFELDVSVQAIFEHNTIASLATYLDVVLLSTVDDESYEEESEEGAF